MKLNFLISLVCSVAAGRPRIFNPAFFKSPILKVPPKFNPLIKKPKISNKQTPEQSSFKPSSPELSTSKQSTSSKVTKIFKTGLTSKPVTNIAGKIAGNYVARKTRGKWNTGHQRAMLERFASPEMLTTLASMIIPFVIWELGQQKLNQDKNSTLQLNQDKNLTLQTYATEDQGSPKVCLDCLVEFQNIWTAIDEKMEPFCEKYPELNFYDAENQNCTEKGIENFFDQKTAEIFKDFGEENNKCSKAKSEYLIQLKNSKCSEENDLMLRCIYDRHYQLEETKNSCEMME